MKETYVQLKLSDAAFEAADLRATAEGKSLCAFLQDLVTSMLIIMEPGSGSQPKQEAIERLHQKYSGGIVHVPLSYKAFRSAAERAEGESVQAYLEELIATDTAFREGYSDDASLGDVDLVDRVDNLFTRVKALETQEKNTVDAVGRRIEELERDTKEAFERRIAAEAERAESIERRLAALEARSEYRPEQWNMLIEREVRTVARFDEKLAEIRAEVEAIRGLGTPNHLLMERFRDLETDTKTRISSLAEQVNHLTMNGSILAELIRQIEQARRSSMTTAMESLEAMSDRIAAVDERVSVICMHAARQSIAQRAAKRWTEAQKEAEATPPGEGCKHGQTA